MFSSGRSALVPLIVLSMLMLANCQSPKEPEIDSVGTPRLTANERDTITADTKDVHSRSTVMAGPATIPLSEATVTSQTDKNGLRVTPKPSGTLAQTGVGSETIHTEDGSKLLVEEPPVFYLSEGNSIMPAGILEEIWVFIGGGGTFKDLAPQPCPGSGPAFREIQNVLTLDILEICTCGWKDDEKLTIKFKAPDRNEAQFSCRAHRSEIEATPSCCRLFSIVPSLPKGEYSVVVSGELQQIESRFSVAPAATPRIRFFDSEVEDEVRLVVKYGLAGFEPYEAVKIVAYTETGSCDGERGCQFRLLVWQEYSVDGDGELLVKVIYPPLDDDFWGTDGFTAVFVEAYGTNSGRADFLPGSLYREGILGDIQSK